jgi:ATPase complex subunit ATP10
MNVTSKFGLRLAGHSRRKTAHAATRSGRPRETTSSLPSVAQNAKLFHHPQSRAFASSSSTSPSNNSPKDFTRLSRLEDANPERIRGIVVNPDSLGYSILPGNLIYKKYNWSGNTRKVPVELVHGYFWMIWDLKNTQQKPTLSNDTLIPRWEAQAFPPLKGLTTLADPTTKVDLPSFFVSSPSQSASAENKVTLVAISFRENGFKMIPSWTGALEGLFPESNVQTYTLSITEQLILYPFRNLLTRVMKQNTPDPAEQARTLVYFGTKDLDDFRDVLRMHNMMTSYVFLLDGNGRVRFAGSGEASSEDAQRLVGFTKELLEEDGSGDRRNRQMKSKQKKKNWR